MATRPWRSASSPRRSRAPAALPGRLPDHPGLGRPPPALDLQELRGDDPSRPRTRSPPCAATIGAAFGGALAVTTTSGPGIALKSEAMNLAIQVELPVIICDVQRGGPSTGLPTKTEQSDLLQVMFRPERRLAARGHRRRLAQGLLRRSRSKPAASPLKFMVPVVLLSDGYIANGSGTLEAARGGRPAGISPALPHRPRGFPALQPRPGGPWRGRGPSPARRAWSTGSAAWRKRT